MTIKKQKTKNKNIDLQTENELKGKNKKPSFYTKIKIMVPK